MPVHLFTRRATGFVLWRLRHVTPAPQLIIGTFAPGNPPQLAAQQELALQRLPGEDDLWGIEAAACGLIDGTVYHYWFEVTDSNPFHEPPQRIWCTDPLATTVDWRLLAPRLPAPYGADDQDPAAVVKFQGGRLIPCDPDGASVSAPPRLSVDQAAPNNRLVIYELPTAWTRINAERNPQIGVGTFRDVIALIKRDAEAANFAEMAALAPGRSHLQELGVNAIELLPIADSFVEREWGYATSNYFAADFNLGFPLAHSSPTATADLVELVRVCHEHKLRFFLDVVMAFATRAALENINFEDFHIDPGRDPDDPDAMSSGDAHGTRERRDGFGGRLWRYIRPVDSYDPVAGGRRSLVPARQLMKAYLLRWLQDFGIDGIRMDSVKNVANWEFIQECTDLTRRSWRDAGGTDDRFLVVGEELSVALELLRQQRLDGLWNEHFKHLVRSVILGQHDEQEPSFEWTVRKLIDCRLLGFTDGAQAINYVGTHDVEGLRNERLFDFLRNNGIVSTEERIKLAFVCLLTAVGIPMIFAGDEFADQHDLGTRHPDKQTDAVNFARVDEPFRRRIFEYVARLVRFRTTSEALAVNDTTFIHVDFHDGKRVVVWQRGQLASGQLAAILILA